MRRPGRVRDEAARDRVRAVLDAPDSSSLTHERVAELAGVSESMARLVRRERGEVAGPRKCAPRKRKPKSSTAPVASPLDPNQAELLTRICDVALGGTNTLRLLEIRGLLKTRVGQQLRETAEAARRMG